MFDQLKVKEFLEYIKIDIVIIVANDNELEVGKNFLSPFSVKDTQYEVINNSLTYFCGLLGVFATCIVKTNNQGSLRDGGARDTVEEVIGFLGEDIIIISAGVAFGLKKDTQKFGDILVSKTFIEYDIARIGRDGNNNRAIPLEVDIRLFNRFSQDIKFSVDGTLYKIFKGEILTAEKLIDNPNFREKLIEDFPEAIGGEMEASGVYRASKKNNVPSILIKSISDWGDGTKEKSFQKQASKICFEYIKSILEKKDVFSEFNITPIINNEGKLKVKGMTIGAKDLLPLIVPRIKLKKLTESEIVHTDYKYYFDESHGYLFLQNHIKSIPSTLYRFSLKKEFKTKSLFVFVAKENKAYVQNHIIDKKTQIKEGNEKYSLNIETIYYINDLISELSQDSDIMNLNENNDLGSDYIYVDQKIYNITQDQIRNEASSYDIASQKGIAHFIEKLQKNSSLISIVTGEGGIGKTRFLDEIQRQVTNLEDNKRVVFLTSDDIIKSNNRIEINSIDDLYKIIMDNNGWDYTETNLLELNFSCGNIILFIDGLEEINSALGDDFNLDGFFESISTVSNKWQNAKIVITTRDEYLDKILNIGCIDEIQFYKLNGFEKEDLEEYLAKVYDGDEKKKNIFYTFLDEMDLYDENQRISPLFADWIGKILEDRSIPIKNKYLIIDSSKEVFKKDKLFQLLIQRELDKKSIEVNKESTENLFSVLVDLIIEYKGQYIEFDDFRDICDSNFDSSYSHDIAEMTLFSRTVDNKIKVRHELLNVLIPARYLLREMLDNQLLSENIDYVLSLYWNGKDDSGHMIEMSKSIEGFIPDPTRSNKLLSNVMNSLKDKIDTRYRDKKEIKNARKAISGCMYLALNINNILEKEERTKLLKNIFNNDFKYMSIYGSFYPISFRDIQIENGYFYRFDNFNNCSFPVTSTVFNNCSFVYIDIENNNEICKSHFDKKCKFRFSNIAEIAMESEKLNQVKRENAEEFLANLAKYIRMGKRSEHLIKRNVSPKPKDLTKTLKLLTDKYKFLRSEKLKKEFVYKIVNSTDADRLKMKDFGGYEELLQALSEEM